MRVIAGKARHLKLKTIEGNDTRPTTDRIKETLFNMLQGAVPGCSFLDLFAGSGAIGIEALSRGASRAVFVEKAPKAVSCIRENLAYTGMADRAVLLRQDVMTALPALEGQHFDIIFMDPPYGQLLEQKALKLLGGLNMTDEHSLIIVEADLKTDFSYLEEFGFTLVREKTYKTNKHVFISARRNDFDETSGISRQL